MNKRPSIFLPNFDKLIKSQREIKISGQYSLRNRPKNLNSIQTSKFTFLTFLPLNLFQFFAIPINTWFLVVSVIQLSLQELWTLTTVVPLLFFLLIRLAREFRFFYKSHIQEKILKNLECLVWQGVCFCPVARKDLNPGDIVLLKEGDEVPADLLLMASGNIERNCYVDVRTVTGEMNLQKKEAVKEIQSLIDSLDVNEAGFYLNTIDGTAVIGDPASSFDELNGRVKMRSAPKSTSIKMEYILLQGSTIRASTWIFGLVLYVGCETKTAMTIKVKSKKRTKTKNYLNKLTLKVCTLVILVSLLHFFFSIYLSSEPKSAVTFFSFFLLYSYAVPFPLVFVLDLSRWLTSLRISYNNPGLTINDPDIMEDLGQVEYVILEKNETLTDNNFKVKACYVNFNLYMLGTQADLDPVEETSFIAAEAESEMEELKKLIEEKNVDAFSFAKSLAICNNAYPQEAEGFVTSNVEDRAIVSSAAEMGMVLEYRDSKKLILAFKELELNYAIVAFKDCSAQSKKCRILVENAEDSSFIYYVRGPLDVMGEVLNSDATSHIERLRMRAPGIRIIVFSCRVLSLQQAKEFKFLLRSARKCPVNREGRIEGVFEQYESEMSPLGFIGTEDTVGNRTKRTLEALNNAGIKTWIASGDSEENTLSSGLGAGIIDANSELLRIFNAESLDELTYLLQDALKSKVFFDNFKVNSEVGSLEGASQRDEPDYLSNRSVYDKRRDSERSLELLRRTSLHPLLSRISNVRSATMVYLARPFNFEAVDYTLMMDGNSLSMALTSEISLKYIVLILFCAKSVCFFNMKPNHKKQLGTVLRKCFKFKPVYMSIGGKSDLGIGFDANIGVNPLSDISTAHFDQIKELLLYHGINFYRNASKAALLCFHNNTSMIILMALYHHYCDYSSMWVVFQDTLIVYILSFQVLLLVPLLMFDESIDMGVAYSSSQVYSSGMRNTSLGPAKILEYFVPAAVSGVVTFALSLVLFTNFEGSNGETADSALLCLYVFIVFTITIQGVALVDTSRISRGILVSHLAMDAALVAYLVITHYAGEQEIAGASGMFFAQPVLVVGAAATATVNIAAFYSAKCWRILFSPDVLEIFKYSSIKESVVITNRMQDFEDNLESVYCDSRISNMLQNQDAYAIHPVFLRFKSRPVEAQYNTGKAKIYYKNYRIYLGLYSLFYIGAFLCAAISDVSQFWIELLLYISSGILCVSLILQFTVLYSNHTFRYIMFFYIFSQTFTVFSIVFLYSSFSTIFALYPLFFLISFAHWWMLIVIGSFIGSILDIYFKCFLFSSSEAYMMCEYAVLILSICLISAYAAYNMEFTKRQEYIMISHVSDEMEKATNVLALLLPEFVINRVKEGVRYISEDLGVVSVLFCNICDFEELISDLAPHELTGFLDELFGKFDQLCEMVGATKIETVGKTYMASAGIKDSEAELDPHLSKVVHARRTVELGFGMIRIIQRIMLRGAKIHIKIGINSGPVRAGVVGYHKPQFSLVGDTVNIASRMAATLTEYDSIQITKACYDLIQDQFGLDFEARTSNVKGKGMMDTFLVTVKAANLNASLENSPIKDQVRGSMRFHNLSIGFLNSYSSQPGTNSADISVRNRSKKETLMEFQWKESLLFNSKASDVIGTVKLCSFSLAETKEERDFRHRTVENSYGIIMNGLRAAILTNSLLLTIEIIYAALHPGLLSLKIWLALSQILVFAALLIAMRRYHLHLLYGLLLELGYLSAIPLILLSDAFDPRHSISTTSLRICFQALLLTQCSALLFKHLSICTLLVFLSWLAYTVSFPSSEACVSFLFILVSLITVYHKEIKMRVYFILESTGKKELTKIDRLLTQMVPAHAYEHLKQECSVIDKFSQVTLLYADIVGFTAWSAEKSPEEVVTMLNEMFTRFDKMCQEHKVYKVHTIGDCYVAMSYIGAKNRDPGEECLNILMFAISMIQTIQEVNQEHSMGIGMRIGVHTGDVIAGITGKTIVRYDIYGNDVYIANSMESYGKSGNIAVSKTTMNIVRAYRPSMFTFQEYRTVEIFEQVIEMYLLGY